MSLATPAIETVLVQCIWPVERGAKDDCQNHTKVIWSGHGDIQSYPKHLVKRLVEDHPTVWRLVDPDAEAAEAEKTAQAAIVAAQQAVKAAEAAKQRAAEARAVAHTREAQAEAERLVAEEAKRKGAEANTHVVTLTLLPVLLSEQDLAAMPDEEVRVEAQKRNYGLHPRLGPAKLPSEFLASQAPLAGQPTG